MSDSCQSGISNGAKESGGQGSTEQERIIVDEDWKARVEREKAAAVGKSNSQTDADPPMPPPTLTALASSLAMQALAALGLLPDPLTGKVEVRLNRARHLIDSINLLFEKTKGNISEDESHALEEMLHELRLTFIQVQSRRESQSAPAADKPAS
ncbi:MAG: DUF1844 domain-containing protein [Thermogutta sp.]